jgi:cytochrome c peroxidase
VRSLVLLAALLAAGCAATAPGYPRLASLTPPDEVGLTPEQLLGKRLFEDTTLSEPHGQSCATCHQAANAFTGNANSPIAAVAVGARPGTFGSRNVPTLSYVSYSPAFAFVPDEDGHPTPTGGQFWDGRAATLAEQAGGPLLNRFEMNNPDKAAVVTKVRQQGYAALARAAYGEQALDDVDAAFARMGQALAAYEGTEGFHPFASKFDNVLRGKEAFNEQEARGFALFKDPEKGNCLACHAGKAASKDPADWLFTDFTFDNVGVPRNTAIPANADPSFFDLGLGARADLPPEQREALEGAFKVPTLRNVARTAPYMHNGYFKELRDVVRFYVTRDTNPELWYPKGQAFNDLPERARKNVNVDEVPYDRKPGQQPRLSEEEIDAVVAFLKTLTDR